MEEDPRRRSALRGRRREHQRRARRSKVRRRRVYEGGARGEEKELTHSFPPRGPTSHGTHPTGCTGVSPVLPVTRDKQLTGSTRGAVEKQIFRSPGCTGRPPVVPRSSTKIPDFWKFENLCMEMDLSWDKEFWLG